MKSKLRPISLFIVISLLAFMLAGCFPEDEFFTEDEFPDEGNPVSDGQGAALEIVNASDVEVCWVYVSPLTDQELDYNINDGSLFPGESMTYTDISAQPYDLLALDCDDGVVDQQLEVPLGSVPIVWEIGKSIRSGAIAGEPTPAAESPPQGEIDSAGDAAPPTPGQALALANSPDLRRIDFGTLTSGQTVTVTVQPDDVSLLFTAIGNDPNEFVIIERIDGPQGNIYQYDWDSGEALSQMLDDPIEEAGEASVYLPVAPQFELIPGDYAITVVTDFDGGIQSSFATLRSGNADTLQALNINYWVLSPETRLADPGFQAQMEGELRSTMDRLLTQQNMQVGEINFVIGSAEDIARFSVIRDEGEAQEHAREACRAMNNVFGVDARAANIALVESIVAPSEGFVAGDIGGVSLGRPGSFMVPGSSYNCTFVALDGNYDFLNNEAGHTTIHEVGHALSLPHTTEEDGLVFDLFLDTPECPVGSYDSNGDAVVDDLECASADANNFMFWSGEAFTVSVDQGWVMRRHPLFYPVN